MTQVPNSEQLETTGPHESHSASLTTDMPDSTRLEQPKDALESDVGDLKHESAAARLQRQHEAAAHQKSQVTPPKRAPVPPGPFDFPDLPRNGKQTERRGTNQDNRKPSYAAMAVNGVMDALDRDFPGPQKRKNSDITSDGLTSGATAQSSFVVQSDAGTSQTSFEDTVRAHTDTDLGDESVIITPGCMRPVESDGTATIRGSPTSPGKSDPHFTKPTEAFSRRTNETLRKESVSPATKIMPDNSANKSTRTAAQRQQKRKSLPGAWMNTPGTSSPEMSPIKKTTSFMAPTKATTRREIATLGQETTKRTSPRVQKSLPRLNAAVGVSQVPIASSPVPASSSTAESASMQSDTHTMPQAQLPRRSTVGSPGMDVLSAQANAAGFPSVPNTTAKRRGSHGHLLLPIKAKLDKYNLWNENLKTTVLEEPQCESSPPKSAVTAVCDALPETPPNQPAAAEESRPKFVPPHVLHQQKIASRTSSAAGSTSAGAVDTIPSMAGRSSQTPSLRATAAEFKPMGQPKTLETELAEFDKNGTLGFKDPEEWRQLPVEDRRAITRVRLLNRARASSATTSAGSPFSSVSKAVNQRYWDGIAAQKTNPSTYGSPNQIVQPGQMLRPELDPETGMLHWVMQDPQGNISPVNFGRAPPPGLCSPSTPSISPTSTDSSPLNFREETPRGWAIGSLAARNDYGWTGGDGKEIKFQGWGPDAERDPNNPVNFSFTGKIPATGVGPRMIGDSEDENSVPLAPRSRRQWAEKMECPQIPCGTVDIVQAAEVPFVQHAMPGTMWDPIHQSGFCFDCTAPPVGPV